MKQRIWVAGIVLAFGVILAFQAMAVRLLRNEVRELKGQLEGASQPEQPTNFKTRTTVESPVSLGSLPQRIATLEESVANLVAVSQMLVDRGVVPPTEDQAEAMRNRFFDPAASDRDRLAALRLIRRGGPITDDVAVEAINWLQTSTNANTKRQLLGQIDGSTNSLLKQPLLAMLGAEPDNNIREELVDVLSSFGADPDVEQQLWQLAFNDPDGDVREEAQDALTDGPATPQRIENFRTRASNPQLSLDERLMALRGLREANATSPEVMAEMANLAHTSQDPVTRTKLFGAFDGMRDPSLMPPLVNGLQDPNPVVRERAADALSSFSSDPRVQEWLNHVIQTDADPRVKREAHQALAESQRGQRGRRN